VTLRPGRALPQVALEGGYPNPFDPARGYPSTPCRGRKRCRSGARSHPDDRPRRRGRVSSTRT